MAGPRVRTAPDGIVIIDKPAGMTSHDVVARLRRVYGTRAVGHAGTLDPMATGVLVLGIERATKLLGHLMATTKEYEATMRLGVRTTTDDAEGEVTAAVDGSRIDDGDIARVIRGFTGDITQVPSSVSAIKVGGVRAYTLAREGVEVALAPRPVTITSIAIRDIRHGEATTDVDVVVTCSHGTYIRALARDIGDALGVGGHLTALRRTRSGRFTLADAMPLPTAGEPAPSMVPLRAVLEREFAVAQLDAEEAALVRNGMRIRSGEAPAGLTGLLDVTGAVLALAEAERGYWHYRAVFPS